MRGIYPCVRQGIRRLNIQPGRGLGIADYLRYAGLPLNAQSARRSIRGILLASGCAQVYTGLLSKRC